MEFRFLGDSGLKVSAISYGNWVTHTEGKAEQATACVRAALEAGITTFDTADTYGKGRAETILGDALVGERRESLEILTKVFGATGPGGPNDSGLSRKHIHESINASLTRLQTDCVDVYQAHRYDFSTPLEETMEAFADVVREIVVRVENEARPIDMAAYRAMAGPVARIRWLISYALVGVLDYTITRRLNFRSEPR